MVSKEEGNNKALVVKNKDWLAHPLCETIIVWLFSFNMCDNFGLCARKEGKSSKCIHLCQVSDPKMNKNIEIETSHSKLIRI